MTITPPSQHRCEICKRWIAQLEVWQHYDGHSAMPPARFRMERAAPNRRVHHRERVAGPDVLFVNVGRGERTGSRCRYDGGEPLVGGHAWLTENGDNCAEQSMFAADEKDLFWSHAGRGAIAAHGETIDLVFVTLDAELEGTARHVAVGMYLDAHWRIEGLGRDRFARVWTRSALEMPPERRPGFRLEWRGRMRRWAQRHSTVELPRLVSMYDRVREALGR